MTPAERLTGRMPSADDIDAIARRTLARLPSPFAESLDDIVLMMLSGLYEGVSLNHQSVSQSGTLPERITLFGRPILAEWRSTPVSLDQLVAHIVIHEVGHHFGFSDDDMHTLEREAE